MTQPFGQESTPIKDKTSRIGQRVKSSPMASSRRRLVGCIKPVLVEGAPGVQNRLEGDIGFLKDHFVPRNPYAPNSATK